MKVTKFLRIIDLILKNKEIILKKNIKKYKILWGRKISRIHNSNNNNKNQSNNSNNSNKIIDPNKL
jgi:hypothetical protein